MKLNYKCSTVGTYVITWYCPQFQQSYIQMLSIHKQTSILGLLAHKVHSQNIQITKMLIRHSDQFFAFVGSWVVMLIKCFNANGLMTELLHQITEKCHLHLSWCFAPWRQSIQPVDRLIKMLSFLSSFIHPSLHRLPGVWYWSDMSTLEGGEMLLW